MHIFLARTPRKASAATGTPKTEKAQSTQKDDGEAQTKPLVHTTHQVPEGTMGIMTVFRWTIVVLFSFVQFEEDLFEDHFAIPLVS